MSVLHVTFRGRMKLVLPIVLMIAFAATRWPGLMPQNFSAAYGLVFCAGVYFSGKTRWWLPLVTLAATDVALNLLQRPFRLPSL
jgi:hypothetical protein